MSITFAYESSEYRFDITINMNKLKVKFSADLNNITLEEIQSFQKKFKKNKKSCSLYFINSKKNTAGIEYEPKTSTLKFCTFNDGYIFSDIDYNMNSVDIELTLEKEEREYFYDIIELIEDSKWYQDQENYTISESESDREDLKVECDSDKKEDLEDLKEDEF